MTNAHIYPRTKALHHAGHFMNVLHAVVYEIYLSAPLHLIGNGITDDLFIQTNDLSIYRLTVGWRGVDDGKITLGGVDIRDYNLAELRKLMGLVM